MPAQLTIRLGGRRGHVSAAALIRALESAIKALRSLEDELEHSADIRWEIIRASTKSPLTITLAAARTNGVAKQRIARRITTAYVRGIAKMERTAVLPDYFTEEAALAVQEMVNAAESDGKKLTVSAGRQKTARPTPKLVTHISEIVAKSRKYSDYGTIEGILQEVSIREGSKIGIRESFTNQWITCSMTPEQLQEAMQYFGKRVAASGTVRYSNHKPTSMTIEEPIQVLRDSSELPQIETMPPIDITGGLSSEEYVQRLRNG